MLLCTFQLQSTIDSQPDSGPGAVANYLAANSRRGDAIVALHPFEYFPLKYHARGRFIARQLLYPKLDVRHYSGYSLLDSSDFADENAIFNGTYERVWVFCAPTDIHLLVKPSGWEIKETIPFPEPIQFLKEMDLMLLVPAKTAASIDADVDHQAREQNGSTGYVTVHGPSGSIDGLPI